MNMEARLGVSTAHRTAKPDSMQTVSDNTALDHLRILLIG